MRSLRFLRLVAGIGALGVCVTGCAGRQAKSPDPDAVAASAPDLSSLPVMILPAQGPPRGSTLRVSVGEPVAGLDSEIGYFLAEQAPRVRWVSSDAVRKAAARARTIGVEPTALAVSGFHTARLTRIGDPLWGDLRLLGEVTNARYAILPFMAGFAPDTTGVTGRVEIGAALIDTGNGRVLWIGYAAGTHGRQDDRAVTASAAQALAKKIAP